MLTFAKLKNRYILQCEFDLIAEWHIGTGRVTAETDAAVILRGGNPFVPGSSLRGVLRSAVERVARSLGVSAAQWICTPFEGTENDRCAAANPEKRRRFEAPEHSSGAMADLLEGREYLCPVCRLFGSTVMAAKLKVGDGTALGDQVLATTVRDGVGINRDTGAAQDKLKYDFQVTRGGRMEAELQVENATTSDFALLHILLEEWRHGVELGGKKARGLGRMKLASVSVQYLDADRGFPLLEYLTAGQLKGDEEGESTSLERFKDEFATFCRQEVDAC